MICHTLVQDSVLVPADPDSDGQREASGDVKSCLGFETKVGASKYWHLYCCVAEKSLYRGF